MKNYTFTFFITNPATGNEFKKCIPLEELFETLMAAMSLAMVLLQQYLEKEFRIKNKDITISQIWITENER